MGNIYALENTYRQSAITHGAFFSELTLDLLTGQELLKVVRMLVG